jgi:Sigma-70, region 4
MLSGDTTFALTWFLVAFCAALLRGAFSNDLASFVAALAALRNKRTGKQGLAVVVGWVARLQVPSSERKDVAQDVVLAACRSWGTFRKDFGSPALRKGRAPRTVAGVPMLTFSRWLNGIAVKVAAEYHAMEHRQFEELTAKPIDPKVEDLALRAPELFDIERERRAALDALLSIPAELRGIIIAHDLDGIPMKEIAEREGVPLSTAYKWRERGFALWFATFERMVGSVGVRRKGDG